MIWLPLILFLIPLFSEVTTLDCILEIRALLFAVFACSFILWKNIKELKDKRGGGLSLFDMVYSACVGLTIISFLFMSQNINAFHYAFIAVGFLSIFLFFRANNIHESIRINKKNFQWLIIVIVGIGFVNALIGLFQYFCGKEIVGTFDVSSFYGCFLAMNATISFGLMLATMGNQSFGMIMRKPHVIPLRCWVFGNRWWERILSVIIFVIILCITILTKSRTAIIALAVVLPMMIFTTKARSLKEKTEITLYKRKSVKFILCLCAFVAVFFVFSGCKYLYKLKPMSASGRVLIWKVSAEMFRKNPISGVGFGNFANYYNLYQAEYFHSGKGSVINKMTAGQIRHAYNWYLETAVEFGLFGLIVFGMFWWLILVEVYKVFVPRNTRNARKESETEYRTPDTEYFLNMGMAGAVLCFMIMSLSNFRE